MILPLFLFFIIICITIIYFQKKRNKKLNQKKEFFTQLKKHFIIKPLSKNEATIQFQKKINLEYVKNFSEFDLMSKTHSHTKDKQAYIDFSIQQIIDWNEKEKDILNQYYIRFLNRISELSLQKMYQLPKQINIIKSTMKHEGDARGYTFLNNIVIKELDYSLFVHEIFHVFTRHNPKIAQKIYETMGFYTADNLVLPNTNIKDKIISNPDTPQIVYTQINYKNNEVYVTPILHSNIKYSSRVQSFFDQLQISLLLVEKRIYNNNSILIYKKISPNLINIDNSNEYKQKLGENTKYNIHPEEVSAKHFEFLIQNSWKTKKNPKIIQKLFFILKG